MAPHEQSLAGKVQSALQQFHFDNENSIHKDPGPADVVVPVDPLQSKSEEEVLGIEELQSMITVE
jgi:hypothetical protein